MYRLQVTQLRDDVAAGSGVLILPGLLLCSWQALAEAAQLPTDSYEESMTWPVMVRDAAGQLQGRSVWVQQARFVPTLALVAAPGGDPAGRPGGSDLRLEHPGRALARLSFVPPAGGEELTAEWPDASGPQVRRLRVPRHAATELDLPLECADPEGLPPTALGAQVLNRAGETVGVLVRAGAAPLGAALWPLAVQVIRPPSGPLGRGPRQLADLFRDALVSPHCPVGLEVIAGQMHEPPSDADWTELLAPAARRRRLVVATGGGGRAAGSGRELN